MRSEKEAASGTGGSGVGGAGRGSGGKEKPPLPPPPPPPPPPLPPPPASSRGGTAMEIQFSRESPRREVETPPTAVSASGCGGGGSSGGGSGGGGGGGSKPREEKKTVLSKVVIRRLPPSLTKEQLEEQLHPLPAHDYFEFCTADPSLYPHLYSRAYINFRNPDDILLFRDRFDGYVFIDSKGLEYPAVVEFAPFQKISKKKLKKKDAKAGSIEEDPEYRKFLETYCVEEEKISANPETLLGEIEAKTRELIARRTTPLLEYIKNRKLEKQRIREEKREERRRRELEKKRLREEEKRKRREEERRKRKEAEKQKKIAEKEIRIKLLKKPEKGEEPAAEKQKEKGEEADIEEGKWEKSSSSGSIKSKPLESSLKELKEKSQNDSDKEQRDMDRRFREKEPERQRTVQPCSYTSQGLAFEHVRALQVKLLTVLQSHLKRLVIEKVRQRIPQELLLRRVKRQSKHAKQICRGYEQISFLRS
ncbi:regulator of nonsense transcripts 3A isoform X3 [Antechinus flavipes]|uniref:regulator of nonsense transcripts 3A isoform X3 n=1 Tax=Antechinus flavipes TaxID=38775 RepID=UPI002236B148|nr:regulator of nonsense transcripts 3A isoform X3 [Antechinus flavipes]